MYIAKVELLMLLEIIYRNRNWHILATLLAVYLITTEIVYMKSKKPNLFSANPVHTIH